MPVNTTPLVNGVAYSWATISVNPFGRPLVGIVSIEYNRKQNKTNNYGAGIDPVSRGYGKREYDGTLEVYLDDWKAFIAASPNRNPMDIPPFDIPVTFSGNGVLATKDLLRAVEFLEDPMSSKSGDTSIILKIPLIIGAINR